MTPKKAFMKGDKRSPDRYNEKFGAPSFDKYSNRFQKVLGKTYGAFYNFNMSKIKMPKMPMPKMPSYLSKKLEKLPLLKKDFSFASSAVGKTRYPGYMETYMSSYADAQASWFKNAMDIFEEGRLKDAVEQLPMVSKQLALKMSRKRLKKFIDDKYAISATSYESFDTKHWQVMLARLSPKQSAALPGSVDLLRTGNFTFEIGDMVDMLNPRGNTPNVKTLNIGGLFVDEAFRPDIIKILSFVYNEIMKPAGVKQVVNGSYSQYSYAMSKKFSDLMQFIDPDIYVHTPPIERFASGMNDADFGYLYGMIIMFYINGSYLKAIFCTFFLLEFKC
jgi:hypothetical protein